ncbi:MAG: EAL domain-containing protein [Maricaulaceae bacterium]
MPLYAHAFMLALYAMTALVGGLALDRVLGANAVAASIGGVVIFLLGLNAHQAFGRRSRMRAEDQRYEDLREAHLTMLDELESAKRQVQDLDVQLRQEAQRRSDAIVSEVRVLEDLIFKLGDSFDERLEAAKRPPPNEAKTSDDRELLRLVEEALDAGRVDLHVQPVVKLPQRKTVFYEAFTRMRDKKGRVIMPADFLKVAEPAGLVSAVDNMLLLRCVQVVRKLATPERRIGVFCNIAPASLGDEDFFPQFLDFMRKNADLAGSLIFEIGQRAFVNRGPIEARNMSRLADYGFRFSVDKIDDLDMDLRDMQRAGVKFAKIKGDRLIGALTPGERGPSTRAAGDVAAEDFAHVLAKYGVDLIADKVEAEATVIELLELDVAFAQGHLFGAPRAIREDVLEPAEDAPLPATEPLRKAS